MQARIRGHPSAPNEQARASTIRDPHTRRRCSPFAFLQSREHGFKDEVGGDAPSPHLNEQVVLAGDGKAIERRPQGHVRPALPGARKGLVDAGAAKTHELFLFDLTDVTTDGRTRSPGHGQGTPVGRMGGLWSCDHFHDIAVRQRGSQGFELPVDLHADGPVTDICVNGIGKVQRHRAPGQTDQLTLGGEHEHLVEIHLELGVFDQIL